MLTLATATYKRYDLLIHMLDSAERGIRRPDRYYIVDNGGSLEPSHIPSVRDKTSIFRPGKNIGVAAAVNHIFRTNDELTVWTNDDVLFETNTISEVERVALEDESRLFVVPQNNPSGIYTVFCARMALFDRVGWFDERFFPAYFEDNDFGYRMKLLGIPYTYAPVTYFHHVSGTLKALNPDERKRHDSWFRDNENLYKRKWGGAPGHETFMEPHE